MADPYASHFHELDQLPIDEKLEQCGKLIANELKAIQECKQQTVTHAASVEEAWRYVTTLAESADLYELVKVNEWKARLQRHCGEAFQAALDEGSSFRARLLAADQAIKDRWKGKGVWDLLGSMDLSHHISLHLMEKLSLLSSGMDYATACVKLKQTAQDRWDESVESKKAVCVRDVESLIQESNITTRKRKRKGKQPMEKAYQNHTNAASSLSTEHARAGAKVLRGDKPLTPRRSSVSSGTSIEMGRATHQEGLPDYDPDDEFGQDFRFNDDPPSSPPPSRPPSRPPSPPTPPTRLPVPTPQPSRCLEKEEENSSMDPTANPPSASPSDPPSVLHASSKAVLASPSASSRLGAPSTLEALDLGQGATTRDEDERQTRPFTLDLHTIRESDHEDEPCDQSSSTPPNPPASGPVAQTSHALPTNDMNGALSSLKDGQWLSSTAMQLIVASFDLPTDKYRVLDPAFIPDSARRLRTKASLRWDGAQIIIAPLNGKGHWTTCIANQATGQIRYFDSNRRPGQTPPEVVSAFAAFLDKSPPSTDTPASTSWDIEYCNNFQQTNGFDCGIHALIWILSYITDLPPPKRVNSKFWRRIFRTLIDVSEDDANVQDPRPASDGDSDFDCSKHSPGPRKSTDSVTSTDNSLAAQQSLILDDLSLVTQCLQDAHASCRLLSRAHQMIRDRSASHERTRSSLTAERQAYRMLQAAFDASAITTGHDAVARSLGLGPQQIDAHLTKLDHEAGHTTSMLRYWGRAQIYWASYSAGVKRRREQVLEQAGDQLEQLEEFRREQSRELDRMMGEMRRGMEMMHDEEDDVDNEKHEGDDVGDQKDEKDEKAEVGGEREAAFYFDESTSK